MMLLMFNDKKIDVKEEYIETVNSKSTGNELNTYRFKIRVTGKEKFDIFKNEMNEFKEKPIFQIDNKENMIAKYNVASWSYRFYNEFDSEEMSYLCNVEISQIEDLNTDILIIEGIENQVLRYREEYDNRNNAIIIHAVIKNTEEQREKINKSIGNNKYFKVIRPGINDKVLEMRYGKSTWSKHEGFIKRNIILVEKQFDDNSIIKKPLLWPELNNIMDIVAKNTIYIEQLEELLKRYNLISDDNIREMKTIVEKEFVTQYRQFYVVEDAEEDFRY